MYFPSLEFVCALCLLSFPPPQATVDLHARARTYSEATRGGKFKSHAGARAPLVAGPLIKDREEGGGGSRLHGLLGLLCNVGCQRARPRKEMKIRRCAYWGGRKKADCSVGNSPSTMYEANRALNSKLCPVQPPKIDLHPPSIIYSRSREYATISPALHISAPSSFQPPEPLQLSLFDDLQNA